MGKFAFVGPKCRRMVIAPAVDIHGWMDDVEHFVKHHVFDDKSGRFTRIQRSANNDRILRRIMMSENTISLSL